MASHPLPPSEVVVTSPGAPAAKADESFTTAPTDIEAMPSSPSSTAPVDTNEFRASIMESEIAPTAITDASTLDGSSLGKLSLPTKDGRPLVFPTTAATSYFEALKARYGDSDSDVEDGNEQIELAKRRQHAKIESNTRVAAEHGQMIYGELLAQKKQSEERHEEVVLSQEELKLGQESIQQGQDEIQLAMALHHEEQKAMLEEQKDILLQFMDRAMKDGDKAKVKMLERRLKAVEAEARAQKNRFQERIDTLEDALAKERSQNARGRSIGLAVASSNVRPSAPSAPAGKRPVVAEMVHCGRRTITAQIEADKTRSRKSTFFSTKR